MDVDWRRLSAAKVAEGLIRAERNWWTAATEWHWGAADPPSRALQDRAVAAVTLPGARTEDEAADVMRLIPGPQMPGPEDFRGTHAPWPRSNGADPLIKPGGDL